MEEAAWAQAIAVLLSCGVAVWAVVVAHSANGRSDAGHSLAQQANGASEESNRIARQALTKSSEANEISEHANRLSQEANAISKAQELRMTDNSIIDWGLDWDKKNAVLTVENLGRDTASDVSVMIRGLNLSRNHGPIQSVPHGEQFEIPLPQFHEIRDQVSRQRAADAKHNFFHGKWRFNVQVLVQWTTPTGKVEWGKPAELDLA